MGTARVKPGDTYNFDVVLWDWLQPLTGKTVTLSIQRQSDGQYWNDVAWQVGQTTVSTTELTTLYPGAQNSGVYRYTFTTPSSPQDTYHATSVFTEGLFEQRWYQDLQATSVLTTADVTVIVDSMWDELIADHNISGSFGELIQLIYALLQDIGGEGFDTNIHSLVEIYNLLIDSITPVIITPDETAALVNGSFFARVVDCVRRYTDEPSINAKYTDNDILNKVVEAWSEIWQDVMFNSEWQVVVRMDVQITSSDLVYQLGPSVGSLLRVARVATDGSELVEWELDQKGYFNPQGFGVRLEGNVLRLGRQWRDEAQTMRIEYIPSGEVAPITGVWQSEEAFTGTSVTLASTTTSGYLDTRPNAYAGYFLRTLPVVGTAPVADDATTIKQERLITAYNPETRVATLATALDPDIALGESELLRYEVVPLLDSLLEKVLCVRAAQDILSIEGHKNRSEMLMMEYRRKIRAVRLAMHSKGGRRATRFDGHIIENRRTGYWGPFGIR